MQSFLKTGKLGSLRNEGERSSTTVASKKTSSATIPWVEKYRPKRIEEVSQQDEVVAVLKNALQTGDLPNLLFYGPPGTGKTSTILALAKQMFGDYYHERVLELNASDERGIQIIREKVKKFSQRTVATVTGANGSPIPPFKIVVLDEADSMTGAAQAALRRTMEKETKSTRFCLICNYVSRIIDPLTSRCAKFRFKPLSQNILKKQLEDICVKENIPHSSEVLHNLIEASEGDLRKAIMFLQSFSNLSSSAPISPTDIYEITGRIPNHWIEDLLEVCRNGVYEAIETFVTNFLTEGYSTSQLLNQLNDRILFSEDFNGKQKNIVCEKLAVCDHRLTEGADEFLLLLDFCCTVKVLLS